MIKISDGSVISCDLASCRVYLELTSDLKQKVFEALGLISDESLALKSMRFKELVEFLVQMSGLAYIQKLSNKGTHSYTFIKIKMSDLA